MIKRRVRAARGKRAKATDTTTPAVTTEPESPWVIEQIDPEKDALKAERDERQKRLAYLDRLVTEVIDG